MTTTRITLDWNGRDEQGRAVPDEAYSLKIDFADGQHHITYFPAARPQAPAQSIPARYFDPRTGIVAYTLPYPARVHMQAGCARIGKNGQPDGPVLKTIVNREPRVAGEVLDHWNGFDESGAIYVPDLPHFVMSIAASPLPQDSIITVGNRSVTFLDYVVHRRGISLVPQRAAGEHHVGLTTLDDISPSLTLSPAASWSGAKKAWIAGNKTVRVGLQLHGPAASRFAKHSDAIIVFVDSHQIETRHSASSATHLMLPHLSPGTHTVAINWVGHNGPVAVNSFRLIAGAPAVSSR